MSDPTPTLIAERYELKRRLAQGGMAEVWLAVDLTLDRKVAVKWLKPLLASDEVVAERFRREAIAAASLNHPNIVAVHDVFEHEGRQAVVMQLVDGKSLRQLLDTQKRLSPELTGHIGASTAAALHHAHENNFVHRDVKPGNIMITPDGRVLLTDFGIAKALAGGDDLTSENIMMGTAKYLSPEQVRGKKLDGRADLYSLGLVLYECLAGRVPFLGETDADTALARLQRDPTDLSRLRATLPTSLVTIIHQLLARNPMHRPATGAELVAALEAAALEGPPDIDNTPHEYSPVAPFSAGRLRRAPSDLDGRADDRRRAVRSESPVSGVSRDERETRGRQTGQTPTTSGPSTGSTTKVSSSNGSFTATGGATSNSTGNSTGNSTRDARRAPTTALPPHRRIPGEPERITGAVPVQTSSSLRDRTPTAGASQRGAPARGMEQNTRPSVVVIGALLALAAIVALLLWTSVNFGGDDGDPTAPTVGPADTSTGAAAETGAAAGLDTGADVATPGLPVADPGGPAVLASIEAYDPDGDGSEKNDEAVNAMADGNPQTNWRTECYKNEFMGGKAGVGLVVTLDRPAQQAISVDVADGPYIVEFFTSASETIPSDFGGWDGQLGGRAFSDDGGTVVSGVPATPVTHVLVLLKQLPADSSCTDANPHRGQLGEITLVG